MSSVFQTLKERGFIAQITHEEPVKKKIRK